MMKLLFFDIDGTLAIERNVPASAEEGIRQCREKGDLVFICTGRNVNYVKRNFAKYADGCICHNGRLAYVGEELIFSAPLRRDQIEELVGRLKELEAGYVFHTLKHGYYEGPEEGFEYMKAVGDPGYLLKGFDERDDEYYNFDIYFRDVPHRDRIRDALSDICILNPHGPHPSADMTVIDVGKGDAIVAVAEKLGIDIRNTYAFGDGMNDIGMLKAAGHGIAMGNGTSETKAAAEFITTDIDHDGVYNGLKHYGLI
ncbi:MAG: HAD hydrolase family protein [Erysipelotrichaceae bacterium]|nr:HAD hydrolase family protein [Erysipelotrichaceae bacterium]